ncbi:sensor histidine kinase [Aliikangiella coralliicola]|nr:ATP-binding protein [Aliikangiella coralliicola]
MQFFQQLSQIKTLNSKVLITIVMGTLSILLGSIVIIGWYTHELTLIQVLPQFVPMQYNTALGFILCGIGILTVLSHHFFISKAVSLAIIFIALLTLIQYIFRVDFGIDQLFMEHYIDLLTSQPGRMAPNTALCFVLTGLAIFIASHQWQGKYKLGTLELIGFFILSLSILALYGYILGAESAYGWSNLTRMAIHTAIGFIFLGVGIITYTWSMETMKIASIPMWIPAVIWLGGLLFDLALPLGVAAGIIYVPLIFCAIWFAQPYASFIFAAIGIFLTILGYFASAPLGENWMVLSNRTLSIFVLIVVSILVYFRRALEIELAGVRLKMEANNTALKRSNEELDNFAHIASHDLKEPLRAIHNHSQFLLEDYENELDEAGVKKLNRLIYLTNRMEKLISDLLYYSRLGREKLAVTETDLNLVISDIKNTMKDQLVSKNVRVKVAEPLPIITCDQVRITELFRNLISNAIKYNDNDEKVIEIGFEEMPENSNVSATRFYVKDNGIGISEEFHIDIFRIFRRLHGPKKYGEGTGSGLTFVKKIVEQHGGKIWCESIPGQGTTFYFTIEREASWNS